MSFVLQDHIHLDVFIYIASYPLASKRVDSKAGGSTTVRMGRGFQVVVTVFHDYPFKYLVYLVIWWYGIEHCLDSDDRVRFRCHEKHYLRNTIGAQVVFIIISDNDESFK